MATWGWDGRNDQGQPVASGSYLVRLMETSLGRATTVKTISVIVLETPGGEAEAALSQARVGPQPWISGPLKVGYPAVPGLGVEARLYDLAGERVGQGADPGGQGSWDSNRVPWRAAYLC